METTTKTISSSIKIYSSLGRCCKYTNTLPRGVQPVFDATTNKFLGFAALPEKEHGTYIYWVKG
jgi:hypothetical protein